MIMRYHEDLIVIQSHSCHVMACRVSSSISTSHLGSCDNLPLVAESRLVGWIGDVRGDEERFHHGDFSLRELLWRKSLFSLIYLYLLPDTSSFGTFLVHCIQFSLNSLFRFSWAAFAASGAGFGMLPKALGGSRGSRHGPVLQAGFGGLKVPVPGGFGAGSWLVAEIWVRVPGKWWNMCWDGCSSRGFGLGSIQYGSGWVRVVEITCLHNYTHTHIYIICI